MQLMRTYHNHVPIPCAVWFRGKGYYCALDNDPDGDWRVGLNVSVLKCEHTWLYKNAYVINPIGVSA